MLGPAPANTSHPAPRGWHRPLLAALCLLAACVRTASGQNPDLDYRVHYDLTLEMGGTGNSTRVTGALRLDQTRALLRRVSISDRPGLSVHAVDDGRLERSAEDVRWYPPAPGGSIRWTQTLAVDDDRTLHVGAHWAVLRFEDLIPPLATRSLKGATATTTATLHLPDGWSAISAYRKVDGQWIVDDPARRFDHPDGWIVAGELAVRRDTYAGTRVAVAAPAGTGRRLLDILAFTGWHLPALREAIGQFPDRLLIAVADEPMFRGGLSAPNSLFLHETRPLISGNGTSTLLHELVHIALGRAAVPGDDWIVEGLAEFYSQELMARTGTLTKKRQRETLRSLAEWGADAHLAGDRASGPVTARAVGIFVALDEEIRTASDNRYTLDDLARRIASNTGPLALAELRTVARQLIGNDSVSLDNDSLEPL